MTIGILSILATSANAGYWSNNNSPSKEGQKYYEYYT